jgi:hypothetical protein
VNAPLAITTTSPLPAGVINAPYSTSLAATGGTGSYTWSEIGSGLPAGVSLSAAGVVSGTPSVSGPFNFTAQVTSGSQTVSKSFSLQVDALLTITTASPLTSGIQNVAYSATLAATGGTGSYTWSVSAGALPAGVSLSAAGVVSGTPSASGSFDFTAQVTDAVQTTTKAFNLTVNPALAISTTSLPDGVTGVAYSANLVATGGTGSYSWTVTSGSLPAGLTLGTNGLISGTPSGTGPSSFTAQVASGTQTQSSTFLISVYEALTIQTTSPLPAGTVGTPYNVALSANGGTASYTWSLAAGSDALPAGLTLNAGGVLSGSPTTAGTSALIVQVVSGAQTTTKGLSLTINPATLVITTASPLPAGTEGTSYSTSLAASGGTPPYSNWQVISGSPPTGLSLDPATGALTGTPAAGTSAASPYSFTVQVEDNAGVPVTASKTFSLTVNPAALVITTTSPLTAGTVGTPYSATLLASGGTASRTWTLAIGSGPLPDGLSLATDGTLSGTPTTAGTSSFTVEVTDGSQTTTKAFSLTIAPPPLVITTTSPLPNGTAGANYTTTFQASGGTPAYTEWQVISGSLPADLSLNLATGELSGPLGAGTAGTYNFTVQVKDSAGTPQITTKAFSLTIE